MSTILVIIPAYNAEKTIAKCLRSLFVQTLRNFTIVIVNDGSTDNTEGEIEKILDRYPENKKKIIVWKQNNQGSNPARNNGWLQKKNEEFVIFCDADIVLEKDCLEKMYNTLRKNLNVAYAYSSFKFGWKKFKLFEFNEDKLKQTPFIHTTSLIRANRFSGFDNSIKRLQDWDLWLTMLARGHKGVWIPEVLFKIISTKGTMSSWLPSFVYNLPFLKKVKEYNRAVKIIKEKHKI